MSQPRTGAIALHVAAAKRLLGELEQHADAACDVLGRDSSADFFSAIDERERLLGELEPVVSSLVRAQAAADKAGGAQDPEIGTLLSGMAQAATRALEAHERLQQHARLERDRLGIALAKTDRPDSIASHYAVASNALRSRSFSVTG
jgi:hypothetical protein